MSASHAISGAIPRHDPDVDALVIGAGVIGLACARALALEGRSVVVVERHASFGQETSSRNSEVVHAGMYYPAGSLKAALCVAGNASLRAYCEARGIACPSIGKYIVATSLDEEGELDRIVARAKDNGVRRLERVSAAHLADAEPNVVASAGLWSPDTAIVDSHAFMASLLADAREAGADVAWQHRIDAIDVDALGYRCAVVDGRGERSALTARTVVNAAGLEADTVNARVGLDVDDAGHRLSYFKGSYFRLRGRRVRHLVYPVPAPKLAGLGVHVTIDLGGGERLGPDVEVLAGRALDYRVDEARGDAFFAAASRYLRNLSRDDLSPDYAGIRPKLTARDGGVPDFVIAEESARGRPGWVSLLGIESPGLTCSLEIAARVARLV